jgi:hypothetical protein
VPDDKALIRVRPQVRAEEQEALDNLSALKTAPCEPEDAADWSSAAAEVRQRWQRLDDLEKTITRPMLQALEAARSVFRPAKAYWREAEGVIKARLGELRVAAEDADRRALQAAREAAKEGDADGAVVALRTRPGKVVTPGTGSRLDWDFEVVSVDLLPPEFLVPDERAIRDEVRRQVNAASGEEPEIPGVRFTRVAKIAIRARR